MPKPSVMTTSEAGLEAGMFREHYGPMGAKGKERGYSYQCSANVWTFGYGSTFYWDADGKVVKVKKGDWISEPDARALFIRQWRQHEKGVAMAITADLTQNQFDTLADMCFNLGTEVLLGQWKVDGDGKAYRAGTGIQRAVNSGAAEQIEPELMRWIRSGGLRNVGLYARCASRVCQWNGLPFKEACYSEPLLVLNSDNTVRSAVSTVTIKARARAFQSANALAAAPEKAIVPAQPAPPTKPAVPKEAETAKPAPETPSPAAPDPAKDNPAETPKVAPKPLSAKTIALSDLPNPNIKAENGSKPMLQTERFWGMFWVAAGNLIQQMVGRGALVGLVPSWSLYLATDISKDPVALGILTTLSVSAVTLLIAAPAMIRQGLKKYRRGQETATQVMR